MSFTFFMQNEKGEEMQDSSPAHLSKVNELKQRLLAIDEYAFKGSDVVGRVFELLAYGNLDLPWRYHNLMKGLIELALKHPEFMQAQGGYKDEAPADLFRMLYFFEQLSQDDNYHNDLYAYVLDQHPRSADVEMIERDIDDLERRRITSTMEVKDLLLKIGAAPSSAQEQLDALRKEMEELKAENALLKKKTGKLVDKGMAMAS